MYLARQVLLNVILAIPMAMVFLYLMMGDAMTYHAVIVTIIATPLFSILTELSVCLLRNISIYTGDPL